MTVRTNMMPRPAHCRAAQRGLSLVELLIALAISAMLLTATMVALDASFKAYAAATEQARTQITIRLVTNRLMTLIRTSTAHGPLQAQGTTTPAVTRDGDVISSHYIELMTPAGDILKVEYHADDQQLWLVQNEGEEGELAQPLIGGVTNAQFSLRRRRDDRGVWVLERATMDMTIQPDADSTLALERGAAPPLRVIASTAPRKLAH